MANIRKRSGDAFAQVDNYLIALKMLGIPSGEVPTLDALVSANDSAKIFFNTSKKAFQVYVDGVWIDTEVNLSDYYNKQEVDNLISGIINGMDWKAAVATYNDLATEYPSPEQGWTVTVNDESVIYQYDGSQWVDIGDMLIPMADATRDGRMSKEDFVKLRDIEAEATKNRSDAYLLNRENFEGQDPISSIEGANAAPNNSIPAKKNDGTFGWVNYSAPKPAGIRKPDGSIIYYDTLFDVLSATYSDPNGDDDILEIYTNTVVDYIIRIDGRRVLNMNGYSLHSTVPTGNAIAIYDEGGPRDKIVNGSKISGITTGYVIYVEMGSYVRIHAEIESTEGAGIVSGEDLTVFGNILAKKQSIGSWDAAVFEIYGNITSIEDSAMDGPGAIVHGNVVTKSIDKPAVVLLAGSDNVIFGDIIIDNPLSEAPAILFNDTEPGGIQTYQLRISGSIIPALGYAAASVRGNEEAVGLHNLMITFLGMQSYKGDIQEVADVPIIVNAEVPFPEIGNEGIEDIIEGSNISIDKTDPKNPVISSTGGGTGLTPEQESKLENTPDNTIEELDGLQDQITINENKLEYVLNFPPDVLNYDFKETIDIKINSIKIEPESGQTVDLGEYILGETLEAYTVIPISVNKGGIIELIGERV